MSHLQTEDTSELEDYIGWRGKLPNGIFNANSERWVDLKGDEPEPGKCRRYNVFTALS
jgi:hypothetical protein